MPPTDPRSSTSPATGKPIAPRAAALVCALALAVLVQIGAGSPAALAAPPRAPTSLSITAVAADPAPRLQTHIQAYLNSRPSTASVMVRNLRNGRQYVYRPTAHYDSASIVKVAILAAVLRRQEQQHRYLTSTENRLLHRMIQYSDNAAASTLYRSLGSGPAMAGFYRRAGMLHTTPGYGGYWGLTQVTAADEVVLLKHLARPSSLLNERGRSYARNLMATVVSWQRWGISAGPAGAGARVELKNGWLSRSSRGWRIHSIGHVSGRGRDYLIAVLTMDNRTMSSGVTTVQGVSQIVWRELAPAAAANLA